MAFEFFVTNPVSNGIVLGYLTKGGVKYEFTATLGEKQDLLDGGSATPITAITWDNNNAPFDFGSIGVSSQYVVQGTNVLLQFNASTYIQGTYESKTSTNPDPTYGAWLYVSDASIIISAVPQTDSGSGGSGNDNVTVVDVSGGGDGDAPPQQWNGTICDNETHEKPAMWASSATSITIMLYASNRGTATWSYSLYAGTATNYDSASPICSGSISVYNLGANAYKKRKVRVTGLTANTDYVLVYTWGMPSNYDGPCPSYGTGTRELKTPIASSSGVPKLSLAEVDTVDVDTVPFSPGQMIFCRDSGLLLYDTSTQLRVELTTEEDD